MAPRSHSLKAHAMPTKNRSFDYFNRSPSVSTCLCALQSSTLPHARCPSSADRSITVSPSLYLPLSIYIYIHIYIYTCTCKERHAHPRYWHHVPHWWHHRRYCHGCRYKHHRVALHARPRNMTLAPSSPLSSSQYVSLRCFREHNMLHLRKYAAR